MSDPMKVAEFKKRLNALDVSGEEEVVLVIPQEDKIGRNYWCTLPSGCNIFWLPESAEIVMPDGTFRQVKVMAIKGDPELGRQGIKYSFVGGTAPE